MKLGVAIVTYNNEETIVRCLESLRSVDVVVVDNNSTDATVEHVRRFPNVVVIANRKNVGFAAAANMAAKNLIADAILFLNSDAVMPASDLPVVTQYINEHSDVGVVGLGLYDSSGLQEPHSWGPPVTPFSVLVRKAVPNTGKVGWVSGGAMIVRKATFEAVGGFDESYFLYWEDVDLCRRVHDQAIKIVRLPEIHVTHLRGHSLANAREKARAYDRSADRYFQAHYPIYIWYPLQIVRRLYRLLRPLAQ